MRPLESHGLDPASSAGAVLSQTTVRVVDNDQFFNRNRHVLGYARAALQLGLDSVDAIFIDEQGTWWNLAIRVSSEIARGGRRATLEVDVVEPPYGISVRELDTLTLLAAGLSNQEIAGRLGNRPKTVATHVERLLAKLDQSTRAGAAAVAAEQGILRLPVPGSGYDLGALAVGLVNEAVHLGLREGLVAKGERRLARRPVRRPVVLGSVLPLIGVASADAEDMRRGAALAVAEINTSGGAAGRAVEHVIAPYDPANPDTLLSAIDGVRGADALTCGYVLDTTAISDVLHKAAGLGVPFLHTLTSRECVDLVARDPKSLGSVFQASSPEDVYGSGFLRFLRYAARVSGGFRGKVALVDSEAEYVGRIPPYVTLRTKSLGLDVVTFRVGSAPSDWAAAARAVREAGVDVAYLSCFVEENLLAFLREHHRDPARTLLYSVYVPSIAGFVERAGHTAENLIWATLVGLYADRFGDGFTHRFKDFHGTFPGRSNACIHYDLVNMLARTWTTTRGPRPIDDVLTALRTTVHRGVSGAYYFGTPGQSCRAFPDECGDASLGQAHLVLQVQDQRHRVIGPTGFAEASLVPLRSPA